jgi:sugar/nucleoside kinase (ribokinase family)
MKGQFTQAIFLTKPAVHVIGSVNIDHLYDCAELSSEGKCILANEYDMQIGGKGLNQAYALFQVSSFLCAIIKK